MIVVHIETLARDFGGDWTWEQPHGSSHFIRVHPNRLQVFSPDNYGDHEVVFQLDVSPPCAPSEFTAESLVAWLRTLPLPNIHLL